MPLLRERSACLQWGRDHSAAEMAARTGTDGIFEYLQWGRDHSAAEIPVAGPVLRLDQWPSMGPRPFGRGNRPVPTVYTASNHSLQWGRDHSAAEIGDTAHPTAAITSLQWGRDHSAAEIIIALCCRPASLAPSMGPRPFGRGNGRKVFVADSVPPPSMGPRPFGRGNTQLQRLWRAYTKTFNGAATIRPRKSARGLRPAFTPRPFNGAATIRPRK